MPEESFQERTEQATPRRLKEAREKGQVAKSRELASVAVLLTGLMTLFFGSTYFYHQLTLILRHYLENAGVIRVNVDNIPDLGLLALRQLSFTLAPLFLLITAMAFMSNFLQVGAVFSLEPIKPKFSKISPLQGLKRIFSVQSLMELAKSILKILVVGWVAFDTVKGELENLLPLLDKTPSQILSYTGHVSFTIFWKTCLVITFLAVLDYMFQRWEHQKNLKMTKQEVKEEYKQTEGDPHIKSRIRSIQREMARKRMMAEVPEADVVITNPTHLAVALKYEAGKMEAPVVVAKGSGLIAQKIREIAREHGVPVIENRPLAQNLFKIVEIGSAIPESLYQAVAEVLAYVYRLKGKVKNQGGAK